MICPKCGNEHIPSASPTTGCCAKAELWLCPNCGCCHHENAEKCIRAIASERDDLKEKLARKTPGVSLKEMLEREPLSYRAQIEGEVSLVWGMKRMAEEDNQQLREELARMQAFAAGAVALGAELQGKLSLLPFSDIEASLLRHQVRSKGQTLRGDDEETLRRMQGHVAALLQQCSHEGCAQ